MKVLVMYDYPPSPAGLATQGHLLHRGLQEMGVEVHSVHFESGQEKEWYYRWFEPDVVVGVGYWGHTPHLVLHPQRYGGGVFASFCFREDRRQAGISRDSTASNDKDY